LQPLRLITIIYIVIILLVSRWWPQNALPAPAAGGWHWTLAMEKNLADNMSRGLPAETSALLRGIMLGEKTAISRAVKDMFSNTGVMHILAVSGMNVGMVALFFFFIFTKIFRLHRKPASFILIMVVILFGQVTGSQASVNRAVVMAIVGLVAVILERDRDMLNSLCLAALLLLAYDPRNLFDVGFQLSFAATLGIILFTPRLQEWLKWSGKIISSTIAVTLGAQLAVTPLIIYYFHKFSLVSPLANLAVVPLVGLITVLGFSSYFLSVICAPLGSLVIHLNNYLLLLLLATVKFFDRWPYAFIYVAVPGIMAIIIYYGLLWCWRAGYRRRYLALGAAGCLALGLAQPRWQTDQLQVSFIDVGQGDSILLRLPDRSALLIDGGGGLQPEYNPGERRVAPFLWSQGVSRVDTILLTHAHYNHVQGLLAVIDRFKVRQVIIPELGAEDMRHEYMREFLSKIKEHKIYLVIWRGGEKLSWNGGLYMENLAGPEDIASRLVYKDSSFFMPGDHAGIAAAGFSVYQVPNHGKGLAGSLPLAGYWVVSSRVIPADNRILSTARDGTITFTSNGRDLRCSSLKISLPKRVK
jgi:DNA internalization-related competence protein ComEC/Rec2